MRLNILFILALALMTAGLAPPARAGGYCSYSSGGTVALTDIFLLSEAGCAAGAMYQATGQNLVDLVDDNTTELATVAGDTFTGLLTANANLSVGNGATTAGVLKLLEDTSDGAHFASFQVPALAANTPYTLPADDGDAGEQLQTDGNGVLTWETASSGSAPDSVDYLVGTANGTLSAEIVVGTTPGGELGGTWASPTLDDNVTVTGWALGTIASGVGTALTALDGENIQDDTIDDDSIDFADVTGADLTLTDATTITASGKITGNASLDIKNGATTAGVLALFEDSDDGTNKATFQVPALASDTVYTLPSNDGEAGDVLQSNGSGTLAWANGIRSVDVPISSAEVLSLHATPKEMVAAPGANKIVVFEGAVAYLDFNSAAYANIAASDNLRFSYTDTSGSVVGAIETIGFLDQTADDDAWANPAQSLTITDIDPQRNAAIVLFLGGAVDTGNSPVGVRVFYRVVDLSTLAAQ